MPNHQDDLTQQITKLTETGLALSREKDIDRLLNLILTSARDLTHADGGTLYIKSEDGQSLQFAIVQNISLSVNLGGISGNSINFAHVPLILENGKKNLSNVSAAAANLEQTFNIDDAYDANDFDFSGTRRFDANTGYRSKSFLTVPMKNHEGDLIGVLQLINALTPEHEIRSFSKIEQSLVESLTSMAATALTQRQLIDAQRKLFDSVVQLIANAIDAKSPYTSGHCKRVPIVANLLARAVNNSDNKEWHKVTLSEDEIYELDIAAWMHDCGKLATPDYIMDKRTKLEGLVDRIHEIEARIAAKLAKYEATLWHQALVQQQNGEPTDNQVIEQKIQAKKQALLDMVEFLKVANIGDEFMAEDKQRNIIQLSREIWPSLNGDLPLLSDTEVELLNISRGTLSAQERKIINDHIIVTIDMLKTLPYPKNLRNVVEIAAGHHERIDGKGYPYGLTGQQLSLRARIMAIADVFEALTAKDRPYKKAKTLSESLKIMSFMVKEGHIDRNLFELFLSQKVYLTYAREHMGNEQIDEVTESVYHHIINAS
jgi:HD-GYP domain-containing protein (c-di-GMP phosphodiesterase class II)